jgi:hypothetical protein
VEFCACEDTGVRTKLITFIFSPTVVWIAMDLPTRISGPYGPLILASAEGTVMRTQGLASLVGPIKV